MKRIFKLSQVIAATALALGGFAAHAADKVTVQLK